VEVEDLHEIRVPGWGRLDARLVLIAESPGKAEVLACPPTPLVGPAGKKWEQWLREAGLTREMFRVENVYEYMPPGSKIEFLAGDPGNLKEILEPWFADLHRRLAKLWDPWLIVPMGNYALYALTGKGKVKWRQREGRGARPGILSWRGSILEYTDLKGRMIKVLPTPHSAATFEQPSLERVCRKDWARIADEARDRRILPTAREHFIKPRLNDLQSFPL